MGRKLCITCRTNTVTKDPIIGVPPYCISCQEKLVSFKTKVPEFAGDKMKEARSMYAEDIIPHHYKGHLNKEWLESKYGGKDRARKEGYTEKEIKEAQYVYSGNLGHSYYKRYS